MAAFMGIHLTPSSSAYLEVIPRFPSTTLTYAHADGIIAGNMVVARGPLPRPFLQRCSGL